MNKEQLYDTFMMTVGMLVASCGDNLDENFGEYIKDIKKLIKEKKE